MKTGIKILALLMLTLVAVAIGLSQTAATPSVANDLPIWILFPVAYFGMLSHWLKGYVRGTITHGLADYIVSGIGQTNSAIVGTTGQVITMVATMDPHSLTLAGIWGVFMLGFATDSIINGTPKQIAAQG